jgi:hypothetical protein
MINNVIGGHANLELFFLDLVFLGSAIIGLDSIVLQYRKP